MCQISIIFRAKKNIFPMPGPYTSSLIAMYLFSSSFISENFLRKKTRKEKRARKNNADGKIRTHDFLIVLDRCASTAAQETKGPWFEYRCFFRNTFYWVCILSTDWPAVASKAKGTKFWCHNIFQNDNYLKVVSYRSFRIEKISWQCKLSDAW